MLPEPPLGPLGGIQRFPVPTEPEFLHDPALNAGGGIHWFGPGGAGVAYPGRLPTRGIRPPGLLPGAGFPHPGLAHIAARRAARQALLFRRRGI